MEELNQFLPYFYEPSKENYAFLDLNVTFKNGMIFTNLQTHTPKLLTCYQHPAISILLLYLAISIFLSYPLQFLTP